MGGPMPTMDVEMGTKRLTDMGQDLFRSFSENANAAIADATGTRDILNKPADLVNSTSDIYDANVYAAGAPERDRIEKVTKFLNAYGRGRKKAPGRSQNLANQVDLLNASKNGGPLLTPGQSGR